MCGVGFSYTPNSNFHKTIANRINSLQSHRGPDNNNIVNYENFTIIHQRLSIIDLDKRSNQPFKYKNIEISYNGEIYNFKELRNELISNGHNFLTYSDTEVLAVGLVECGLNFLQKIDGMFAFCFIDHLQKKLFCSCDPFGIKQLYYYYSDNIFFITSELELNKKIVNELGKNLSQNQYHFEHVLSYLALPPHLTPFNEIKRISRGDLLELDLFNSINLKLKKSFITKNIVKKNKNMKDHNELEIILDQSMNADVDQSILLSGGIDSTNLALSSINNKSFFKGYFLDTALSSDGYQNDQPYAQKCANYSSIPIEIIKKNSLLEPEDILDTLSRSSNVGDLSASISLSKVMSSIANDSIKVCYSGIGADEIYGGYRLMKILIFSML